MFRDCSDRLAGQGSPDYVDSVCGNILVLQALSGSRRCANTEREPDQQPSQERSRRPASGTAHHTRAPKARFLKPSKRFRSWDYRFTDRDNRFLVLRLRFRIMNRRCRRKQALRHSGGTAATGVVKSSRSFAIRNTFGARDVDLDQINMRHLELPAHQLNLPFRTP